MENSSEDLTIFHLLVENWSGSSNFPQKTEGFVENSSEDLTILADLSQNWSGSSNFPQKTEGFVENCHYYEHFCRKCSYFFNPIKIELKSNFNRIFIPRANLASKIYFATKFVLTRAPAHARALYILRDLPTGVDLEIYI